MRGHVLRSEADARLRADFTRGALLFGLFAICVGFIVWYAALARMMFERLAMNDFGRFYYSARLFLAGSDMYGPSPATLVSLPNGWVQQFWNMNPPHFHLLILPLALLPPLPALVIWACASVLGLAFAAAVVVKELRVSVSFSGVMWATAAALAFASTGTIVVTGQVSWLLLPLVALAWRDARHGRWARAGAWLGVGISLKPFLLVFLPWLVLRGRIRSAVGAVMTAAACFGAGWIVFGADAHRAWLRVLSDVGWHWAAMNGSLMGLLSRMFSESPYYTPWLQASAVIAPLWTIGAAVVGLITIYVVWRDTAEGSVDRAFLVLLLAAQLISPLGWVYYLWLALPAAAALVVRRTEDGGRASHSAASRWRDGLAILALPGLIWPLQATIVSEPTAWLTLIPGSLYFFAAALLWGSGVADWYDAMRAQSPSECT